MSSHVGGIDCALAMCNALGISFDLEPLVRDPFFHNYGMNCSEANLTIGIWKHPLVDLHVIRFELPFYLVEGDEYLLVGNKIASKCQIRNDENLTIIPEGTEGLSGEDNLHADVPFQRSSHASSCCSCPV